MEWWVNHSRQLSKAELNAVQEVGGSGAEQISGFSASQST